MRFLKPALRRIHVYQLCFKINFKKKTYFLKQALNINFGLNLVCCLAGLLFNPIPDFRPGSAGQALELEKDLETGEDYRPKGEMKSRNVLIRKTAYGIISISVIPVAGLSLK